jgi:hypothetical protein
MPDRGFAARPDPAVRSHGAALHHQDALRQDGALFCAYPVILRTDHRNKSPSYQMLSEKSPAQARFLL